jgi:hypothetical protein
MEFWYSCMIAYKILCTAPLGQLGFWTCSPDKSLGYEKVVLFTGFLNPTGYVRYYVSQFLLTNLIIASRLKQASEYAQWRFATQQRKDESAGNWMYSIMYTIIWIKKGRAIYWIRELKPSIKGFLFENQKEK